MTSEQKPAGSGASPVDGSYAWFRLGISVTLGLIGSVGMWVSVLILPAVQSEFDVDRGTASLPYTMTMVGFALGNVLIGRYVDRLGITIPVIGAGMALGVGYISASFTTEIWQFSVIQGVLIGIGTAASFGPLIADISHWFERRRGVAVAATAGGNYIGGSVWPLVLQGFVQSEGWRATYFGIGIFCVVTMVPLALMLRRRPTHAVHAGGGAADPPPLLAIDLTPRALQTLLAVAGIGCCVAMSMPQVHIVAYAVDLGFGTTRGAEMLSLMFFGGIFSRLGSGFLADHIGAVRTLLLGSVLQCLALLLFLPFDGPTSLYVISFAFGLSQGGIVPCYALIVREFMPAREAGQRVGIVIMATIVGMAFGGWVSGWIYDQTGSYQSAFLNGIVWNLLNISIMAMVVLRSRRAQTLYS